MFFSFLFLLFYSPFHVLLPFASTTLKVQMDKKRQKTTEDRKKMRKPKEAEPEASSKSVTSDVKQQQQTSLRELTDTKSDQSDGNLRMKIGVGAKRTKKPPKSLENFICRPTIRISQRLAPSKHMRKTDSKSLLTSDGPSYAVQPQTDSKVPLSDKITSSTLLKQTYSPPAAP
uniref:Uncharacterized protein n=1 Tax=Sinocyclocheilus rhinocerous TaxID=307959 RepID=A0A673FXN3_9TELE